jgi:hypothetical protein
MELIAGPVSIKLSSGRYLTDNIKDQADIDGKCHRPNFVYPANFSFR